MIKVEMPINRSSLIKGSPMERKAGLAVRMLLLSLLVITWVIEVVSQNGGPAGLSIDCGSDKNYTDEKGISWVTDAAYISTGKTIQNLKVTSNSTIFNDQQSQSLRYFDEGRSRDCYVLPVVPQNTYLIRPTFYYGDWNSPGNVTAFDVYLNSNLWIEGFLYDQDTSSSFKYDTYQLEALAYMTTDQLDFCLVRHSGTPFISSLELRQLAAGMYTEVTGNHQFMSFLDRWNTGADLNGPPYLRYPDDLYDRLWLTPSSTFDNATHIRTTTKLTVSPNLTPERPPPKVMEDAWVYYNSNELWFIVTYDNPGPVGLIAVYSYFQEVDGNASASNVRTMNYYVNDIRIDSFALDLVNPYEVGGCVLNIYDNYININITNTSGLTPILNAFEIYYVFSWSRTATATKDVNSIEGIKNELNLTDWTGDPCVPVPYDWLNCSTFVNQTAADNQMMTPDNTAYVTEMSLANIVTLQIVPEETANLSRLTSLNLSNTGLASIPSTGFSFPQNLTVLDLSNNRFSRVQALSFLQSINVTGLQSLYASNNALEGEFPLEQLYAQFPNLEEANFDSNPNINGVLNLTVWHTVLISLNSNANVKAEAAPSPTTAPTPASAPASAYTPLVSLTNNSITGITPSLDVLMSDITTYLGNLQSAAPYSFNNHGLLLGGNPWCQQQAFNTQSLAQQYLCRSNSNQALPGLGSLYPSKRTTDVGAIIGGVLGGFALLVACILLAVVWRLRKQTSSLKEVQEELARQSVKPPFFSYSDLRTATNDFSPENKLGQGTFGDVYKGGLSRGNDGTPELMAVKRLYPSKLALPEFLNETVLITGIKHRNLVQLKGCCINRQDQRMLVYEYAENGNLAEALWGGQSGENREAKDMRPTLDWNQRLEICVGIARGLSYLHEELQPRIIHRDIKPANILLDKNFKAKIADFGLARSMVEGQSEVEFTKVAGTNGYFSPEYATQGQLTEKADVFSCGVVLLEIVSGRKAIDLDLPSEQQFLQSWARHLKSKGKLLDLLDPAARKTANNIEVLRVINLAFLCLEFYPESRPTMSQAVAMLQGIMDVTLYRSSESDTPSGPFRASDPFNYMKLPLISLDSSSEEDRTLRSLETNATSSSTNTHLEMSKLSGR